MKRLVLLALSALPFAAAAEESFAEGVSSTFALNTREVEVASDALEHGGGTLTADETWAAGSVHVVYGTIIVATNATLTIEPGAVVKFLGGGLYAAGTCVANGVTFTDIADGGVDGGHAGRVTLPMPSYVLKGNVETDGATRIRFAKTGDEIASMGDSGAFSIDIADDEFRLTHEEEPIAFSSAWANGTDVKVSVIRPDGGVEVLVNESGIVAGVVPWTKPSALGLYELRHESGGETLTAKFAVVDGVVHDGAIVGNETWGKDKVHIVGNNLEVANGATLTIEPGAVVKFIDGKVLTVEDGGTCIAEGVVFTSIYDDTVGGDTLNDGTATEPITNGYSIVGFVKDDLATEYRYGVQSYTGTLAGEVEWRKEKTYVIDGTLTVATNGVLTIPAGTVVKFTEGSGIKVADGGVCIAEGAIFTHIADDAVGGDTMGDGDATKPTYGAYTVDVAVVDSNDTEYRYSAPIVTSGTLSGNNVWRARQVYHVTGNLTLASGATLTIAPGSVIKFEPNVSLTVNGGATLDAQGTRSSPIVFTSIRDDAHGGDTNGDGDATVPNPGDWKKISVYGQANLNYCSLLYAAAGTGTDDAMFVSGGTAVFNNSVIAHGQMYAVGLESGNFFMTNSVITDVFCVFRHWPSDPVVNSVIYNCTRLSNNNGQKFVNCIIQGISKEWDWSGGSGNTYSNCLIYNPEPTDNQTPPGNFAGVNGNVWGVDPLFVDPDNGDFRIAADSPCVDAGDARTAPAKDYYGQPRQGTAPEIGICEIMPRDMVADIDLTVVAVAASQRCTAGEKVSVVWTVHNLGTEDAIGERYDKVEFLSDMDVVVSEQTIRRTERIMAGGEVIVTDSVVAPTTEGSFFVRVVANCSRAIVEGASYGNNVGVSDSRVAVELGVELSRDGANGWLAAGASAVHRFAVDGAGLVKVNARPGTVVVARDGGSSQDYVATVGSDGFVLLPIGTASSTVDVVLQGGETSGNYEVTFLSDTMAITGCAPGRISHEGTSVIRVEGVGLDGTVSVLLRGNGGEKRPSSVRAVGGVMLVSVDGASLEAGGAYDIVLRRDGETKEIADAFAVDSVAGSGKAFVKLNVPEEARYGKKYECTLQYGNDGASDILAPVFQIEANPNIRFFYIGDQTEYETLQFFGAGAHGSAGVIAPGESHEIRFAVVYRGEGTVSVKSSLNNSAYPQEWASETAYLDDLRRAADRIDMRGGDATDFGSARELAEKLNAGEADDVIYGWWHHADMTPVAGAALVFTNGEASVMVTTDANGRYETGALTAGTWHLEGRPGVRAVVETGCDTRIDVRETGKITAVVSVNSNEESVSVVATESETGESRQALPYGESDWVFYSLPTGFYSVAVRTGDNRAAASTMLVEDSADILTLYVSPEAMGTICGRVTGRAEDDSEVPVWVIGAAQEWLVMPDARGAWSVKDVPSGYCSVELLTTNATTYTQYEAVELEPGGTLTCDIRATGLSTGASAAVPSSAPRTTKARLASARLLGTSSEPASDDFDAWLAYASSVYNQYTIDAPVSPYDCKHNQNKYYADLRRRENFFAFIVSMDEIQANASKAALWLPRLEALKQLGDTSWSGVERCAKKAKMLVVTIASHELADLMTDAVLDIPDLADAIGDIRDASNGIATTCGAINVALYAWNLTDIATHISQLRQYASQIKRGCKRIRIHGKTAKVAKFLEKYSIVADIADYIANDLRSAWDIGNQIDEANKRYALAMDLKKHSVGNIKSMVRDYISKAKSFNNYPLCCYSNPNPPYTNANPTVTVTLYQPIDPNEIKGPLGIGAEQYVKNGDWMDYTICFENKTNANAAAWDVYISLPKDGELDWSTFESAGVSCGDWLDTNLSGMFDGVSTYAVPGTNFSVRTEITHTADAVNWHLRIIDPVTLDNYPDDPAAGFLPPNDGTGRGEGYVRYRVKVRDDAFADSIINASASIVFDYNDPIETDPAWWNTVGQEVSVTINNGEGAARKQLFVGAPYGDALPESPTNGVPGYTFVGWRTGPNGTGRRVTAESLVEAGDSGIYASWTANGYEMAFHANGGEGEMPNQTNTYGVVSCLSSNVFTRTGHRYLGWATNETGEVVYADGAMVSNLTAAAGGVVDLYAVWELVTMEVAFDANGGSLGTASPTMVVTNGVAYGVLPVVEREGYSFDGWANGLAASSTRVTEATIVTNETDHTLYAQWTVNAYSVTFNANGGEGGWSRKMEYGMDITAPTVTRDGYTFVGWQPALLTTVPASNVTFTASWTAVPPEPEIPVLWTDTDATGRVPPVACVYDGYLYDKDRALVGTIQVKVGKAKLDKKTQSFTAAVKATVVGLDGKKKSLKAVEKGKAAIESDGPTEIELVGGEACTVTLGAKGMSGTYGSYDIDGALNVFTSKDADDEATATVVLGKWQGAVNVAWRTDTTGRVPPYQTMTVTVANKGKVKVAGTLADGTKVSVSSQLLVGEEWCCVPVLVTKKVQMAFVLWLPKDATGRTDATGRVPPSVVGLGENVKVGKPGTLKSGAAFRIDAAVFAAAWGQAALPYLPDGVPVGGGSKWVLPKAGKVMYVKGTTDVDESKAGENPSGLKLTYKAKDGTFKGSFKAYEDVNGKPKGVTVNVTGVLVNGVGYGAATIKKVGGVPVTVE